MNTWEKLRWLPGDKGFRWAVLYIGIFVAKLIGDIDGSATSLAFDGFAVFVGCWLFTRTWVRRFP